MFQTTYAYFTDLNYDVEAFEGYKQKQTSFFKNMASQPNFFFQQEFYTYLNKEIPRFNGLVPTEKTWAETDYKLAYDKYKERFANAADFEFFFVGNVDDKAIEDFSAKYLLFTGNSCKRKGKRSRLPHAERRTQKSSQQRKRPEK